MGGAIIDTPGIKGFGSYDMNQEDIRWSANSLGDYGHTSGYDALAGFLLASTSLMKANNIFD